MNKYKNKKIVIDRYVFDSIAEGKRYRELVLLEKAGKISNLELQRKYLLIQKQKFKYQNNTLKSAYYQHYNKPN